jgi:hypothetical protein
MTSRITMLSMFTVMAKRFMADHYTVPLTEIGKLPIMHTTSCM